MAKQTFTTGQVLTAAQMTSLQQTSMGGGSTTAKTASYTLVAADAGTVVQMNSASATTITVNTALFAAGDTVQIQNVGAGVCTVTAGTATVSTSATLALKQYDGGQLYFNTTSAALFFSSDAADATSATLVGVGLTKSSDQSLTNATYTAISFDGEGWDTDTYHDNTTNNSRITIPSGKAGKYLVTVNFSYAASGTGSIRLVNIYKNGVATGDNNFPTNPTFNSCAVRSVVMDLAVADYIQAFAYQDSGGALNLKATSLGTVFQATYLGV